MTAVTKIGRDQTQLVRIFSKVGGARLTGRSR